MADKLKQYDIKQVYISPFYRCDCCRSFIKCLLRALRVAVFLVAHNAKFLLLQWADSANPHLMYASTCGRCIQTARLCTEGLQIPPERWTVSVAVCEVSPSYRCNIEAIAFLARHVNVPPADCSWCINM